MLIRACSSSSESTAVNSGIVLDIVHDDALPPVQGSRVQLEQVLLNLLKNAVYAVFLMTLLLMIEFRSFGLTFMILALLPLSLGGAMPGLVLTGNAFLGVSLNDCVLNAGATAEAVLAFMPRSMRG